VRPGGPNKRNPTPCWLFALVAKQQPTERAGWLLNMESGNPLLGDGSQQSKIRRLTIRQCDESKPVCHSCNRHGVSCVYENTPPKSSTSTTPIQDTSPNGRQQSPKGDFLEDYRADGPPLAVLHLEDEFAQGITHSSDFDDSNGFDVPESKSRRLLELRLLQHYIDRTSKTMAATHHDDILNAWASEVPKLALQHDNLLYQILSMSTLHLLKSKPNDPELLVARQIYQGLALREHRKAVATLSTKNADAVCCASSLIYVDAFASIQARPIEPYSPPMEWLKLARGAGSVYAPAIAALVNTKVYESTVINAITSRHPYFDNVNSLFEEINRKRLLQLLSQDIGDEPWDQETQQAYEKTLSYIGWVQNAIQKGEHSMSICRKMMGFSVLAPRRFVVFIEEMRPRALVILSYWFALGAQLRDFWWIGETVQREIQAIQQVVPPEWQPLMRDPLLKVGLTTA
jgi:Fungal specific transcription factor domain